MFFDVCEEGEEATAPLKGGESQHNPKEGKGRRTTTPRSKGDVSTGPEEEDEEEEEESRPQGGREQLPPSLPLLPEEGRGETAPPTRRRRKAAPPTRGLNFENCFDPVAHKKRKNIAF